MRNGDIREYKLFIAPSVNEQGESIGLGVYPYDNKNKVLLKPEFLDLKKNYT